MRKSLYIVTHNNCLVNTEAIKLKMGKRKITLSHPVPHAPPLHL